VSGVDEDEEFELEKHLDRLWEKARIAYNEERYALVIELLTPYLRHRPDRSFGWLKLGKSLDGIGLFFEAEQALLRADGVENAHRPYTLTALGNLYEDQGQYELAESFYAQAVEHPKAEQMGWIWIMRGSNFARWNHLADAEKCHRKALELSDCDHDEAWLNIGLVLRAQGKYDEAIDAFNRALEICPDYEEAKERLESLRGIKGALTLARQTPPVVDGQ
jgi:superkiller protein 3